MNARQWQLFLFLGVLVIAANGCATQSLWSDSKFARFQEPALSPNLSVFESPRTRDLLVAYDETPEDDKLHIQRRAYWLPRNSTPKANPYRPKFVSPDLARGLVPVPMVDSITNGLPDLPLFVAMAANGQDFLIYEQQVLMGEYQLPTYHKTSDRTALVLLTPLTVTADTTIVGGIVAVWLAPYYWESLNCLVH